VFACRDDEIRGRKEMYLIICKKRTAMFGRSAVLRKKVMKKI